MKKHLLSLGVVFALVVPAAATGGSSDYGVALRSATVNPDRSVTIAWSLENASVFNSWIAIDGSTVRYGSDRATRFTTRPLHGGSHTITIEVHAMFETYSPPQGARCEVSGGHWLCVQSWRSASYVIVPSEAQTYCLVPTVVGLQLKVARTTITTARCSLGAVKRVRSKRPAGTVISQRAKPTKRLAEGTSIALVVSKASRPT
jgi:hypothetical protein